MLARRLLLCAAAAMLLPADADAGGPQAPDRKLIAFGWEFYNRSPSEIVAHAEQFDATGLNGVQVMLSRRMPDGRVLSARTLPLDPEWPSDVFDAEIPALRKMSEHRGLRDSFLLLFRTPDRRVPWTDDSAWRRIGANMRTLARVARAGNMRGFAIDTEDYPQQRQFSVMPGDPSYEALAPLVRKRAQDLFRGVFAEQPEAVVLSFWLLSNSMNAAAGRDPADVLASMGDVWPAFVNGILDVLPPSATLVDGCEWAYDYESARDEFVKSSLWQRESAVSLTAPENRVKYRGQTLPSSGHYMDRYLVRDPKSRWALKPLNGSYLRCFERNLAQGVAASGGYVWLWCERRCWIKWDGRLPLFDNVSSETWEEGLPGLSDLLTSFSFPDEFVRRRVAELRAKGRFVNIVPEGAMDTGRKYPVPGFQPNELPKAFARWEDSSPWLHASKGTFGVDTSVGDGDSLSLSTRGVGAGGFKYTVKGVEGGDIYLVRVSAKGENPYAYVGGWDMRRWYRGLPGVGIPLKMSDSGWMRGTAFVRVPGDTVAFTVYLNSRNTRDGINWFDNLEIYRIWGDPYPDVSATEAK